jgi:hypothetical protein
MDTKEIRVLPFLEIERNMYRFLENKGIYPDAIFLSAKKYKKLYKSKLKELFGLQVLWLNEEYPDFLVACVDWK